MQYEKAYELRAADFDAFDRMHPASVLELLQDVAGIHANELGIGYHALIEKQTIWVLTKVRYRVVRQPRRYEQVVVRTWPLRPGRVSFRREYEMATPAGEVLLYGTSEWVVVHSEKRCVLPASDLYPSDEYRLDTQWEGRLAKVNDGISGDDGCVVRPAFTDLDINGHVNNAKYANYVVNALPPAKGAVVTEFAIDYHREVLQDMPLRICCREEGGVIFARGLSETGEHMFSCRMVLQ